LNEQSYITVYDSPIGKKGSKTSASLQNLTEQSHSP